jgi:hypothetical protein
MKLIFYIVLAISLLWTGIVVFANMMKPGETGGFIGANTLVVAWWRLPSSRLRCGGSNADRAVALTAARS